jgi:Glycosyl hydrolase family 79 C-terminal beta domain
MASSHLEQYVARAHANGATYRIDEMGSVTCNGHAGVSDTMASALWAGDALFSAARAGVDGINLHSFPNSANGLFDFTQTGGHWTGIVHPLYYGALMFAQAAPPGSRLVQTTSSDQTLLRAWSTRTGDGVVRVLLINDSPNGAATATVTPPAADRNGYATVERLQAHSASATTGVTLGGHGFGAKTSTGALPAPSTTNLEPHHGVYKVKLPAASAALLTIRQAPYGIAPPN